VTVRAAVVRQLLQRATRAEAPVVESLALAAGMLWRCLNKYCKAVNNEGEGICESCGIARKLP
jgi:hypothetical protein